jgi:hypothetical protein
VRPRYRVQLSVVIDFTVFAASATGAVEEAKAIAVEVCEAKGLPLVSTFAENVQRLYPEEPQYVQALA